MDFLVQAPEVGSFSVNSLSCGGGIELYEVRAVYPEERIPEPFKVTFSVPHVDIYSVWSPAWFRGTRFERRLGPSWSKRETSSRLASWMPLHTLVSADGRNKIAVALSDAKTPAAICTGVREENAEVEWEIKFFSMQVAPLKEYRAIIRIDTRDIPYYDAIYDVVDWWENACGYKPAKVPEHAKLPMNSLWYSYHQQLDVEDIIRECALSKAMGMDTVIIDDGWQTDDNSRGYRFCGDWEVTPAKIPDMKQFVDRIHGTGMKVILWYGVPFVGVSTKAYARFSDMLLDEVGRKDAWYALDPRYPEVRQYLTDLYAKAQKDWGLDGFKLDFIDSFYLGGKSLEYDPRRDYQSLEDAVDRLMTDVTDTLRAVDPEVLIEFRQTYVGPAIRKYGNMFRVGDCPNDAYTNRQGIVDLRFTSGSTAVHSDMLMWNREDSVESAALQLASVLYSVPQVSVKIASLPEAHKKMLKYYLSFWREHRDVLLEGRLRGENPESVYSIVCAEKKEKAIYTAYTDTVMDCGRYKQVIGVNCSRRPKLILRGAKGRTLRVVNCMGQILYTGIAEDFLWEIEVPMSGMVFVN